MRESNSSRDPQTSLLAQRVLDLEKLVEQQTASATRRKRNSVLAGSILVVVCVLALTSLTDLASQLDAHALSELGRQEIEKHLPAGRASFSKLLIDESPQVVRGSLESLLNLLPRLRAMLVSDVKLRLRTVTKEFEDLLRAQMQESVRASKALIVERFPILDNTQRIEKLVVLVGRDFNQNVDRLLEHLYPKYASELERIRSFLSDMNSGDAQGLTAKERTQKELVQTLLKLMVLEKQKEL